MSLPDPSDVSYYTAIEEISQETGWSQELTEEASKNVNCPVESLRRHPRLHWEMFHLVMVYVLGLYSPYGLIYRKQLL